MAGVLLKHQIRWVWFPSQDASDQFGLSPLLVIVANEGLGRDPRAPKHVKKFLVVTSQHPEHGGTTQGIVIDPGPNLYILKVMQVWFR